MSDVELGHRPDQLTVNLNLTEDWSTLLTVTAADGTPIGWPAGITTALEFGPATAPPIAVWEATIAGGTALFTAPAADADSLPAGTPVQWVFTVNGARQIPNTGRVSRGGTGTGLTVGGQPAVVVFPGSGQPGLNIVFVPGPPGPPGAPGADAGAVVFDFPTAAGTWSMTHNLGRLPATVTAYDQLGAVEVAYDTDTTTAVITWNTPTAGTAVIT